MPLCDSCTTPRRCHRGALLCPFDDGNGLWITFKESPRDQDKIECASPQD